MAPKYRFKRSEDTILDRTKNTHAGISQSQPACFRTIPVARRSMRESTYQHRRPVTASFAAVRLHLLSFFTFGKDSFNGVLLLLRQIEVNPDEQLGNDAQNHEDNAG